jgi:hypothetical protein
MDGEIVTKKTGEVDVVCPGCELVFSLPDNPASDWLCKECEEEWGDSKVLLVFVPEVHDNYDVPAKHCKCNKHVEKDCPVHGVYH